MRIPPFRGGRAWPRREPFSRRRPGPRTGAQSSPPPGATGRPRANGRDSSSTASTVPSSAAAVTVRPGREPVDRPGGGSAATSTGSAPSALASGCPARAVRGGGRTGRGRGSGRCVRPRRGGAGGGCRRGRRSGPGGLGRSPGTGRLGLQGGLGSPQTPPHREISGYSRSARAGPRRTAPGVDVAATGQDQPVQPPHQRGGLARRAAGSPAARPPGPPARRRCTAGARWHLPDGEPGGLDVGRDPDDGPLHDILSLQRGDVRARDAAVDQELRAGDEARRRRWPGTPPPPRSRTPRRSGRPARAPGGAAARSGSLANSSRSSGVLTGPGHSAFTRMPSRANWTPSSRDMASTPPFEAV